MRSVAAHNQYVSNRHPATAALQGTSTVSAGLRSTTTLASRVAVIGIDLGTSAVKVIVTDQDGTPLGRGTAGYAVTVPATGQAESDPGEWWTACRRAVHQALADAGQVNVAAVGVAGQMHGVVLSEADGRLLRPAILWLDQRATAEAATYADLPDKLTAPLGNRPSPGMAGPILMWLARHEPQSLRAAWWALQPKDWLRLRLTGAALTDPTDASGTLLFDLTQNAWSDDLIAALNLPPGKLPPVREPRASGGRLLPGPARELGLPPGIPVAVGAADTAAALYAAALRPDEAMLTLGSGGQWVVPVQTLPAECSIDGAARPASRGGYGAAPDPVDSANWEITLTWHGSASSDTYRSAGTGTGTGTGTAPPSATNLYRAVGGTWYRLAPLQNVGVTLDWVRHLLGASWDDLYDTAALSPGLGAPAFQPYLTQERWDPNATGEWTGLTLAHQREDLLRSALDGVAQLVRRRLDDLRAAGHRPRRVILAGGGTTHPAWRALLAETLALPLHPAPTTWLTPQGAARLAALHLK
jgi:xylulokinase